MWEWHRDPGWLAGRKSALNPPVVYSADHSKAVVLVLVLLFVALSFILRGDLFYVLTLCYFVLVFFSPFSIVITSLGEERANLSAFRTFVWFVLVWFYRFPLPLGVWKGLRFVIVTLSGLFSYLFLLILSCFSFGIHKQPTIPFNHDLAVVSRHSSKIHNLLCSCCIRTFFCDTQATNHSL